MGWKRESSKAELSDMCLNKLFKFCGLLSVPLHPRKAFSDISLCFPFLHVTNNKLPEQHTIQTQYSHLLVFFLVSTFQLIFYPSFTHDGSVPRSAGYFGWLFPWRAWSNTSKQNRGINFVAVASLGILFFFDLLILLSWWACYSTTLWTVSYCSLSRFSRLSALLPSQEHNEGGYVLPVAIPFRLTLSGLSPFTICYGLVHFGQFTRNRLYSKIPLKRDIAILDYCRFFKSYGWNSCNHHEISTNGWEVSLLLSGHYFKETTQSPRFNLFLPNCFELLTR